MRIPRIVLALVLVGAPVTTLAISATAVLAEPFTYAAVDMSQDAACALTTDGIAMCWGENRDSWLISTSREQIIDLPTPVRLPNNDRFVSLNGGGNHTWCGLAVSGAVYCWGEHHLGSLFTPTSKTPVAVEFPAVSTITKVGSGFSLGCALNTLGELWCWGDVLDSGSGETEPTRTPVKVAIPAAERVIDFDLGGTPCAVTDIGNIYCWGHQNEGGQLGLGYPSSIAYAVSVLPAKVVAPSGIQFVSVTTGLEHGCALSTVGTGYCWGENYAGLFGNNTSANSYVPTPMIVPNNEAIAQISTGWYHTCIRTTSNKTWCAGRNDFAEFGTGTTLGGKTFRAPLLPDGIYFTSVVAALSGTCGLDQNGDVWCSGYMNRRIAEAIGTTQSLFQRMIPRVGSPTVTTANVTNIGSESAQVNGTVNANGYATTTRAEYATTREFARSISVPVLATFIDRNYSTVEIPQSLQQLEPRTSYFVRLVATNALGTTYGNTVEFITIGDNPRLREPTVSAITGNEASISVAVLPGLLSTSSVLRYSSDETCAIDCVSVSLADSNGAEPATLTADLSGLRAQNKYFATVTATNKLGATTASFSFTTIGDIAHAVIASHSVSNTSISAQVEVETGELAGSIALEVSTSELFTNVATSSLSYYMSNGPLSHSLTVSALAAYTDYFIRTVTTNELGTTRSSALAVRTLGGIPHITHLRFDTSETSAALNATLDTTGLDTFVTVMLSTHSNMKSATEYFVYAGTRSHTLEYTLPTLLPRTTYYLTIAASNEVGASISAVQSFTTRTPIGVLINNAAPSTATPAVTLTLTTPSNVVAIRVSNYSDFREARVFSRVSSIEWALLPTVESTQERSVWVQFVNTNGVTSEYSDSISVSSAASTDSTNTSPVSAASLSAPVITVRTSQISSAPIVRVATIKVGKASARIMRVQTKLGRTVTTRRISANKAGKFVLTIPRGTKTMMVRLIDARGKASNWRKVV
jgi:hypothetical protein